MMSFTRCVDIRIGFNIVILICFIEKAFAAQSDELFTCGFEDAGYCSMEHGSTGDFDWTKRSGPSHWSSGPRSAYSGRYYNHLNVRSNYPSKKAIIKTAQLGYSGVVCVSFAYHMYGQDIGSLKVKTSYPNEVIFIKEGEQGYNWTHTHLDVNITLKSRIQFEGLTGNGPLGNIALDEIHVTPGSCASQDNEICDPVEYNCPGGQRCEPDGDIYRCSCEQGYDMLDGGSTCIDIDECATDQFEHGCSQRCTNNAGGYSCTCDTGYSSIDGGRTCQDINECMRSRPCRHSCNNTQGSYHCYCREGYRLLADGYTCTDIDECTTDHFEHGCSQRCTNTDGSYYCTCDTGYSSTDGGRTCQDIDECATGIHVCPQQCTNTVGRYRCTCDTGYSSIDGGRTCQECLPGKFGDGCSQECHCAAEEGCDVTTGACPMEDCADGYTGDTCSEACSPGRFGHGCRQECHCAGGEGCDVTTGTCPLAACADGYTGDTCSEGCADAYEQVLDSSKAFTSTCPVVEEIIQIELDRCFRKACEGATVNMVTYRSPVCVLRLCQPGEYQLKPSVGILGWDIYLRKTTSPMGQINGESFPLWQILVGLVIGLVVLVTLAVVIGIKRRRPSPAMGTAKAHVRCVSDPGLAPPGGQGENAIYDEIMETKTIDGPRDKTVVLSTREQGAAFYQNRMLPPIDNDPVYCDDMATAPPGGRGAGDTSSDCVAYVESTDWETHETDVTEIAGSTGCSDGRDYQNSKFTNGDKYEVLAPTAPVSSIQYEALQ